ncbi:MAG TPA: hypothetical protein ENO23_04460 [Alphaproteobacteria bacterium]|nr:hypothetical protein [Alphaproteobacteria bacterium]
MGKIFVRERRHAGRGTGRPRFAVIASQGLDLNVYKTRLRRVELETLASALDAEIVYLPRGEGSGEQEGEEQPRRRRRHHDTG